MNNAFGKYIYCNLKRHVVSSFVIYFNENMQVAVIYLLELYYIRTFTFEWLYLDVNAYMQMRGIISIYILLQK